MISISIKDTINSNTSRKSTSLLKLLSSKLLMKWRSTKTSKITWRMPRFPKSWITKRQSRKSSGSKANRRLAKCNHRLNNTTQWVTTLGRSLSTTNMEATTMRTAITMISMVVAMTKRVGIMMLQATTMLQTVLRCNNNNNSRTTSNRNPAETEATWTSTRSISDSFHLISKWGFGVLGSNT